MSASAPPPTRPPEELIGLAREAIAAADLVDVPMRLVGGLAFYALVQSAREGALARSYKDFDVVVPPKASGATSKVLEGLGFIPNKHFNALHGARRLIFSSPEGFPVDVLVGEFVMCHRIDVASGLDRHPLTIAPADLLLSKLQIVQIEDKDLADAAAFLLDLHPGDGGFDVDRFVEPLADDWGFHRTVEINLGKLRDFARAKLEPGLAGLVGQRLEMLADAMVAATKSLRWKLRAKVGERVQWYDLPEEV